MFHIVRNSGIALATVIAFDPATVLAKALFLRKLRRIAPELFDAELAHENVELAIADIVSKL